MATKILHNTAICKLSTETDTETGEKVYYLSRGTKRFRLYGAFGYAHEKALMYMGPHEHDNRVEHWVNGQWQSSV